MAEFDPIPLAIVLWHAVILHTLTQIVPEPYMDEQFHIPQAQQYCKGNFREWDPMITTFPGIYLYSSAVYYALHMAWSGISCSATFLRATAASAHVAVYVLARTAVERVAASSEASVGVWAVRLRAATIAAIPMLAFVSSLYYTDALALATVLAVNLCGQTLARHNDILTVLACVVCSCISILTRQTNAVWVAFAAGHCAWLAVSRWYEEHRCSSRDLCRSIARAATGVFLGSSDDAISALARQFRTIAVAFGSPVTGFAVFLVINHGVVVGDRSSHAPVFHFAQLCYALGLCGAFVVLEDSCLLLEHVILGSPRHSANEATISYLWKGLRRWRRASLAAVAVVIVLTTLAVAWLLDRYTYAHKYLLADNRHYMFYVWARTIGRYPSLRVALAPAYVGAAVLILARTIKGATKSRSAMVLFGVHALWLISTALTLIPSHLVEPRYFIFPLAIWMLFVQPVSIPSGNSNSSSVPRVHRAAWVVQPSTITSATILSLWVAIGSVLWYVFLYMPFTAPDGSVGRFMF